VQIIHKKQGQITHLDHIGSAHNQEELTALIAVVRNKLHHNQPSLFPDMTSQLTSQLKQSFSSLLWRVLNQQYDHPDFDQLNDGVRALCIARLVEPTSKIDSLRVMADPGSN